MKIFKNIAFVLAAGFGLASCTPSYPELSPERIPMASDLDVVIEVNQETNYVTFSVTNKEVIPVWIFGSEKIDGKASSKYAYTTNELCLRFREIGEHTVEVKAMNANGLSDGSVVKTFTIENEYRDPFDPSPYIKVLSGGSSQTWQWNNTVAGHMGCGPSGSDGLEWWSAGPNDKKDWSLYDDRLTFDMEGKYTYDPTDGMVYVHNSSNYKPEYMTEAGVDYMAPMEKYTCEYEIVNSWNDAGIEEVYLVLPEGKNLSYIPNPTGFKEPRFRFLETKPASIKKCMKLVIDTPTENGGGGIAWHYEFVPEGSVTNEDDKPQGPTWDPKDASNLYLQASKSQFKVWFADNNWTPITESLDALSYTATETGFSIVLPEGALGSNQWQGQFHILNSGIAVDPAKVYDVYCIVSPSCDLPAVTFKVCESGNDGNSLALIERVPAKAYEETVIKAVALAGITASSVDIVFDLPGGVSGASVEIKDIIIREHVGDIPLEPEDPTIYEPNSDRNLWKNASKTTYKVWFADGGWAPFIESIDGLSEFKLTGLGFSFKMPAGVGGDKWQGQLHFLNTGIALSASKKYDFYCVVNTENAHPGVTIKLAQTGDDGTYILEQRHQIAEYEDVVIKYSNLEGKDMSDLALVFDFAGGVAGSTISVSDILIQEHAE